MKYFFLRLALALVLAAQLKAQIPGTVAVSAPVAPPATNSPFGSTDTRWAKGGYGTWATNLSQLTDVSWLPNGRKQVNMREAIGTNEYILGSDLTTWTESSSILKFSGYGTNTYLVAPIITDLASFSLTPSAYYSFGTANTQGLTAIGDSITYGAAATAWTNTYPKIFATTIGLALTNIANGSFSIPDANWSIWPGWLVTNITTGSPGIQRAPAEITEDSNTSILIGFNDVRGSGSASMYRLGLDHLIHYAAIPDSAKRFAQSATPTTGTWTNIPWIGNGNIGMASGSGTLTFSNVVGSEVYIAYLGWATNFGGTISVTVDGVSVGSATTASAAYGNRSYPTPDPNIPPNNGPYGTGAIDFCPQLMTATGVGLTGHTVVVTVTGSQTSVLWVAGNGFKRDNRSGPNVFVGTILRQQPWTGGGTDTRQGSFNSQLISAVAAARAGGLRVILEPTGEYYNPFTDQSGDGVHPNNTGHAVLAQAFAANSGMDLTSFGGLSIAGSAALGPGAFTTLTANSTANFSGNTTVGGRLLVLPTFVSDVSGVFSRFGYGGTPASSVVIHHSTTTLDRELDISGNSISVKVTSTGVSAPLSLGTAGTNVNLAGSASIAEGLTVAGVSTFSTNLIVSGRLLVVTATPVQISSRFGAGGSTNSSILIYHGDPALDREMVVTGNAITTHSSSGAVPADLYLSESGASVNMVGSAAIGAGLAVTGTATFSTNLTVNGRLLVTTPTPVQLTSRFGGGGSTNSSIILYHGDPALDRELVVTGNAISAHTASGSVPTTLYLSEAGGTVSVGDSLIVNGSTTLTGTVNKVTVTPPTTGATLTIDDGKTLSAPLDATVSGINQGDAYDDALLMAAALGSSIKATTVGAKMGLMASSAYALADTVGRVSPIYIPKAMTITGVGFVSAVAGSFTGDATNSIALYSYSGGTLTKVAETANDPNIWKNTAGNYVQVNFASTYAASAGLYFMIGLYNQSAEVTPPQIKALVPPGVNGVVTLDYANSAKVTGHIASAVQPTTQSMSVINTSSTALAFYTLY